MNMIYSEISFKFFYFHFSKKLGEYLSEILFEYAVYFSFTIFWTNHDMIGTIPSDMSHWNMRSIGCIHVEKRVMVYKV